ncbi:MAG: MBL fold metallo-hydrolase [Puniceicoccales bacterium]|jgi:beta-lactamase superfamily II metal-dependent hydrolase|nr:MBL fold metallo-hydrolase [Puniceicoccales bacterium]
MRYFPPVFLLFFLLKGVLCGIAFANVLETYIFAVGQGNFILMKIGTEWLVVDVGSGKSGKNPLRQHREKMEPNGAIRKKLESIGKEISKCWLLVTHNHWDHFCLFLQLRALFQRKPIIFPSSRNRPTIGLRFLAESFHDSFHEQVTIEDPPRIGNVYVSRLPPHQNAQKAHERNLIVFVKYGTVLFILPGDADGDYINLNVRAFTDRLNKLSDGCTHCCIILPHHGSNSNGTLSLSQGAYIKLVEKNCEVIFVISSNPEERDRLPKADVLLLPSRPATVEHRYAFFNKGLGRIEKIPTTSPVFITSEVTDGNGYLITTDGSDLKLFDGIAIDKLQLYPIQ